MARNRELLDGLQAYFQRAGVTSRTTRTLGDSNTLAAASTAVVLFPDDFESVEVVKHVALLRARRPRLLIVLITSEPQRLSAVMKADADSVLPLVFSRPVFGWSILEAIGGGGSPATAD